MLPVSMLLLLVYSVYAAISNSESGMGTPSAVASVIMAKQ